MYLVTVKCPLLFQLCVRLQDTADCTREMDPYMYEPYVWCRSDNLWCGFDDEESVAEKVSYSHSKHEMESLLWIINQTSCIETHFMLKYFNILK